MDRSPDTDHETIERKRKNLGRAIQNNFTLFDHLNYFQFLRFLFSCVF